MIIDHIRNRHLYASLGSGIAAALEYCADALEKYNTTGEFAEGDVEIGGGVIMKSHPVTTREANGTFEAHEKYADIHFVVSGCECIGYAPTDALTVVRRDEDKDMIYLEGRGINVPLGPGDFMITLPDDAHMPCVKQDESVFCAKLIAKVLL
jgi:YhcH/YjgK/YiaL family protein